MANSWRAQKSNKQQNTTQAQIGEAFSPDSDPPGFSRFSLQTPDSWLIMHPTMLFFRAVPAWRPDAWHWAKPTVFDPRKGLCLLFSRWTAAALSWPIYLGSVNGLASLAFRHLTRSFCPERQLPESLGGTKPLNRDKVVNLGGAFKWASPSNQSVQWQIRQEGAAESSAMSPYEGGKKSQPLRKEQLFCIWEWHNNLFKWIWKTLCCAGHC